MSKPLELSEKTGYACSYSRLQVLFHEAIRIVEEMEFPLEKLNRTCGVNSRYTSRWGTCYHNSRTGNRIEVSQQLLKADEKSIMTTLLHEVLHATEGCHNHGDLWKMRAEKINRKYGYNIKTHTGAEEKGFSEEEVISESKYVFKCKKCGQIVAKNRACNFTNNPNNFKHTICGGREWIRLKPPLC